MNANKPRVLVVDDNRLNIKVLANALQNDYQVMAATKFEQTLAAVEGRHPPELILLDVMMPDMDGYEVCARLKAHPLARDIPIIFVTAKDGEMDEAKGFEAGAVDFLTKPISSVVVRSRVATQLKLRQQYEALERASDTIRRQNLRMEEELATGQRLQGSFLPDLPQDARFRLSAAIESALELSGDFYDAFWIDDQKLCLVVGDVSGKGVAAAIYMGMTRALIRSKASRLQNVSMIVTETNAQLATANEHCMFVTLFVGIVDFSRNTLTYSNAGHLPPILLRSGDAIELDDMHGPALGVVGFDYTASVVDLQPSDTLMIYTDGITEARSDSAEFYGRERLKQLVMSCAEDPAEMVRTVLNDVQTFAGAKRGADDITVMSLHCTGAVTPCHQFSLTRDQAQNGAFAVALGRFLEGTQLDDVDRRLAQILFDELINNVLMHGDHGDAELEISGGIEVEDDQLVVWVSDNGRPFDPTAVAQPDTDALLADREVGGLGIHLCRQLVDRMVYRWESGRNVISLIKRKEMAECSD